MSYTKRQFVSGAFEEIGLASNNFDLQPEDLQTALRRLDAMMAEWAGKGIYLGYPVPASPEDSDLDDESNAPYYANEAIITNLALRIAPSYGKQMQQDSRMIARQGYNTLMSRAATPPQMQFPSSLPRGAGNKTYRSNSERYFSTPIDNNTDPASQLFLNME
jgi:hypothetical protein